MIYRNTKSSSYIYLQTNSELYLLGDLCLAKNSSSIRSASHLNPDFFSSSLEWECRHDGLSISTGNMVSAPYTSAKGVS